METSQHLAILKRVGIVLIVVGLIDICVMIYCILHEISYSSSFNFFAVIAGLLLVRGSLRTAKVVRWYLVFQLAVLLPAICLIPFIASWDLTLTYLRLNPTLLKTICAIAVVMAVFFYALFWVVRELGRQPVQSAFVEVGLSRSSTRTPVLVGFGMVLFLAGMFAYLMNGSWAQHAKELAKKQTGTGYNFFVSSLHSSGGPGQRKVSAGVVAWNHSEIREIDVDWKDPADVTKK